MSTMAGPFAIGGNTGMKGVERREAETETETETMDPPSSETSEASSIERSGSFLPLMSAGNSVMLLGVEGPEEAASDWRSSSMSKRSVRVGTGMASLGIAGVMAAAANERAARPRVVDGRRGPSGRTESEAKMSIFFEGGSSALRFSISLTSFSNSLRALGGESGEGKSGKRVPEHYAYKTISDLSSRGEKN